MNDGIDIIFGEMLEKLAHDEYEAGKSLSYIADKFDIDYISEIINKMADISSDIQIHDYKEQLSNMLAAAREEKDAFQNVFTNKWKHGLMMSQALRYICIDSIKHTDSFQHDTYLLKSLRQLYIRSCQVYYEVFVLISNGLADGAWARWRTLYELSIVATFIAENGEDAARGYFESENTNEPYYEWARSLPCFNGYRQEWSITFNSIYQKCRNSPERWKQIYQTASVTVHACAKGTFSSFGGNGTNTDGIGSEIYGIDIPAIYAAESIAMVANYYLSNFLDLNSIAYLKTIFGWVKRLRQCYSDDKIK